jgi:hypothetical protein
MCYWVGLYSKDKQQVWIFGRGKQEVVPRLTGGDKEEVEAEEVVQHDDVLQQPDEDQK